MRLTLSRKQLLVGFAITVLVLYVGLNVARGISEYVHERNAQKSAEELRMEASRDAQPSWTQDDAITWLKQHEFREVGKGKGWQQSADQPTEHFLFATGTHKVAEKGPLVKPYWVRIDFVFDLDHRFKRVDSDLSSLAPRSERD